MIGSGRAAGAAIGLAFAIAAALAGGCTVGNGTGAVRGPIYLLGCSDEGNDYGSAASPRDFDLSPRFFAGEPIEDVGIVGKPNNRLLIRLQRTGNRIEVNDTLSMHTVPAACQLSIRADISEPMYLQCNLQNVGTYLSSRRA